MEDYRDYRDFILTFPDHEVAYGTFLALKPFYVRGTTSSDLEMCCCKLHLHANWSIKVCTLLWRIVEESRNSRGCGNNKMATGEFYDFTVK